MATTDKIIEMIGAIKTIYPYYSKDISDNQLKTLVRTWETLLKNYPDDVVEIGFYKSLQVCKMPPTPADVIEQINAIVETYEPSNEELWGVYEKALRDTWQQIQMFSYTYIDSTGISQGQRARNKVEAIWAGLPEKIKLHIASKGELMRLAREYNFNEDFGTFEKQRFMKAMPIMKKRQEYSGLMLENGSERFLLK
jgi:hypothetical protein